MLFASLSGYRRAWLAADLLAGALLAAIAIPEQVATARLAGMPPQAGLYAFAAGTLAFAIFGVNRFLSVGADSTIAPIFAVTIAGIAASGSPEYAALVGGLAVLVGAVLALSGILRAGWISELLSIPVTIGFLAGIAVHIVIGQLPALFGISVTQKALLPRLEEIVAGLPHTNFYALGIGLGVLAAALLAQRFSEKLPGAFLALVAAAAMVALLGLQSRGVAVLGALPALMPHLLIPPITAADLARLVPLALVVAIVCMVQTAAVMRAVRTSEEEPQTLNRDLAAVGIGSIAAGFLGSFPVDASPPRSVLSQSSGGRTQLTGLVAVAAIAAIVAFAGKLAANVPEAALAAVLIFIATRIFRVGDMLKIARQSRLEVALVAAAAMLVIVLPINDGMIFSILLSLFYGSYALARPPCVELTHVPGTTIWWPPGPQEKGETQPGVLVFAAAAPIYFMNVRFILGRLRECVASAPQPVKLVVLEAGAIIDIDYTGALALEAEIRALRDRRIDVALARLSDERAQTAATRTGLIAQIGQDHVFKSADEAIRALA